jgi:hypothetical protein
MNVASQLIGTSNAAEAQTVHMAEEKINEQCDYGLTTPYIVIDITVVDQQL